jgi:hypothetical protein
VPAYFACSSSRVTNGTGERFGQNAAALTAADANVRVTATAFGNIHETAGVFVPSCVHGTDPNKQGTWIVGWNSNASEKRNGWSYSNDRTATSWTTNVMANATDWGRPGNSPTTGGAFVGWNGDPSLALVTNTNVLGGNTRVFYTNVADVLNDGGVEGDDGVIAYSDDCGQTWTGANYFNDGNTGGNLDNPVIASNPNAPFSTWVVWTNQSGNAGAHARSISIDSSGSYTFGTIKDIPAPSGGSVSHPQVSVGKYFNCAGIGQEAVYIAYVNGGAQGGGRCPGGADASVSSVDWWLVAIVPTGIKGPWKLGSTDTAYPSCVGSPLGGSGVVDGDNDPRPRIATDPNTGEIWVAHTQHTAYGTRVAVENGFIVCRSFQPTPSGWTTHLAPHPCYKVPDSGVDCANLADAGPGGTPVIIDEWEPAIAWATNNGNPTVAVSWYDTRDDMPNNKLIDVWAFVSTSGNSFNDPFLIGFTTPGTSEVVPWDHTQAETWDYNGMVSDPLGSGYFLATWGGDYRSGSPAGVFSMVLQ